MKWYPSDCRPIRGLPYSETAAAGRRSTRPRANTCVQPKSGRAILAGCGSESLIDLVGHTFLLFRFIFIPSDTVDCSSFLVWTLQLSSIWQCVFPVGIGLSPWCFLAWTRIHWTWWLNRYVLYSVQIPCLEVISRYVYIHFSSVFDVRSNNKINVPNMRKVLVEEGQQEDRVSRDGIIPF